MSVYYFRMILGIILGIEDVAIKLGDKVFEFTEFIFFYRS